MMVVFDCLDFVIVGMAVQCPDVIAVLLSTCFRQCLFMMKGADLGLFPCRQACTYSFEHLSLALYTTGAFCFSNHIGLFLMPQSEPPYEAYK